MAVWMIGFGILVGVVFPFFVVALGISTDQAFTFFFFAGTLAAGIIVATVNFGLAHWVVRSRLRLISQQMCRVETVLHEAMFSGDMTDCDPRTCFVPGESADDIGQCASAFNALVNTLFRTHEVEFAVGQFTEALTSQLELAALSKSALHLLIRHTDASAGAVLVNKKGALEVVAQEGLKNVTELAADDHVQRALETLENQIIDVPSDVMIGGVVVDFRPRQIVVIPIDSNRTIFGAVILANGNTFAANLLRHIVLFRRGLGLAVQNALQHERLQEIAAVDPLTGLYNRRFGVARLREEFTRAVRADGKLGAIMFDIDHFKRVNDAYGHLVGDQVLARVARSALSLFRESDVVVRLGGEEFCAFVPGAGTAECLAIGERLRHVIEESHTNDGESEVAVTVSVGVSAMPDDAPTNHEDLLKWSDDALYLAKRLGRNQVCARPTAASSLGSNARPEQVAHHDFETPHPPESFRPPDA